MRKVGFDREFEYKDLPDETTPDNSENANIGIHNTWYLIQQLENLIDSKTGSNIEITECAEAMLNKLEIEGKSTQDGEPSPDNPIEIKSVGYSNLFNEDDPQAFNYGNRGSSISATRNDDGTWTTSINGLAKAAKETPLKLKKNTDYTVSIFVNKIETTSLTKKFGIGIDAFDTNDIYIKHVSVKESNKVMDRLVFTFNSGDNEKWGLFVSGVFEANVTGSVTFSEIQVVEGTEEKTYIPYGKSGLELSISNDTETKTTTFTLNEPLRSLPNEIKDLLYVKNGHLFVERKIKEIFLNGTEESWGNVAISTNDLYVRFTLNDFNDTDKYKSKTYYLCNKFKFTYSSRIDLDFEFIGNTTTSGSNRLFIFIKKERLSTSDVNGFKEWLAENNLKVYYEQANPTIEDLGEIEMPITFKDKSTITTTDELEPTINLEYVKDTILTDYIEKRLISLIK